MAPGFQSRLLIVGASGHAKVVLDAVRAAGTLAVAGLVDRDHSEGETVFGAPILGNDREIPRIVRAHDVDCVIIAVGDNWTRAQLVQSLSAEMPSISFATIVHPSTCVAAGVELGEGTVVFAGAVLNAGTRVGRHCIINTNASVDHDGVLGDFVTVAPGATLGGNVTVGEHSTIALGANVIHSVSIGRHTILGAGATAITDLPDQSVAVGLPARVVRSRLPGEPYL